MRICTKWQCKKKCQIIYNLSYCTQAPTGQYFCVFRTFNLVCHREEINCMCCGVMKLTPRWISKACKLLTAISIGFHHLWLLQFLVFFQQLEISCSPPFVLPKWFLQFTKKKKKKKFSQKRTSDFNPLLEGKGFKREVLLHNLRIYKL